MEAQIAQLDNQIQQTDTIKNLQGGQDKILETIREDRAKNQEAFDKGAAKFDDLYQKVEDMKKQISDGFKDIGNKITDNEISRLQKALDKKDNRMWDATKIILTAIISIVATALLYKLGIQ